MYRRTHTTGDKYLIAGPLNTKVFVNCLQVRSVVRDGYVLIIVKKGDDFIATVSLANSISTHQMSPDVTSRALYQSVVLWWPEMCVYCILCPLHDNKD